MVESSGRAGKAGRAACGQRPAGPRAPAGPARGQVQARAGARSPRRARPTLTPSALRARAPGHQAPPSAASGQPGPRASRRTRTRRQPRGGSRTAQRARPEEGPSLRDPGQPGCTRRKAGDARAAAAGGPGFWSARLLSVCSFTVTSVTETREGSSAHFRGKACVCSHCAFTAHSQVSSRHHVSDPAAPSACPSLRPC